MPRRPRFEAAGAVHHVYARGDDRRRIFRDDRDFRRYLSLVGRAVAWKRWRCLAYCLMPNHLHLLVETPEPNLGAGMQWLQGTYARGFNDRHNRVGHVFQGRYGNVPIATDEQLWTVVAYVALNPVHAGLCKRAEQWHWGSHAALLDGDGPTWLARARLLGLLQAAGGDPLDRYARLVQDPIEGGAIGAARE